jgi:hypothetical protein
MVHALDRTHRLLKPGGTLIDIHPLQVEPQLEVRVGVITHAAGVIRETDGGIEYEQAEQAMAEAVRAGWFAPEIDERFEFRRYADALSDLREYLAATWKDAVIDEHTAARIEALMATPETDTELIVREQIRMTRYRRLDRSGTLMAPPPMPQ